MGRWSVIRMKKTQELAERITRAIPKIPRGSLRFWGAWFGRPYDAFHAVVGCEAEDGVLRMRFDAGETLSVWSPSGVTANQSTFRISDANRVLWEWFYYGRPQTQENLRFYDYMKSEAGIEVSTNAEWYSSESRFPEFRPSITRPAVEIVPP